MKARIEVNPNIHFGKPCVSGTRIPVQSVLEFVREGFSFVEIIGNYYPDLKVEDIRACVQYAIDVVAIEDVGNMTPTMAESNKEDLLNWRRTREPFKVETTR